MRRDRRIIELIILVGFIFFIIPSLSFGVSRFEKEKEIPDEYLTRLFTPEFPYESIRVVEVPTGMRFIVVKAKEKISRGTLNQYSALLLSRGVSIYGTFHYGMFSWDKTVTDYAITITRKMEGEPDSVEASESVVRDPKTHEPIVAASAKGKEIRIAIEHNFAKKWKKIRIIPQKEIEAPEPKIGRYPGSKLFKLSVYGQARIPTYVSKDTLKHVYDYYEAKVKTSFMKAYGFPFAKEMFENPNAYSHSPISVFGIKTIGRDFWIDGDNQVPGEKWSSIKIKGYQSLDPSLSEFIQIEISEWEK